MASIPWPSAACRRRRAIRGTALLFSLIVASTMFFSLTATTGNGAAYDCGPAAFALMAGPGEQTRHRANCRRAAGQRLTTVTGLVVLATIGAAIGPRLLDTNEPEPVRAYPVLDSRAVDRPRHPRPTRRRSPFADTIG